MQRVSASTTLNLGRSNALQIVERGNNLKLDSPHRHTYTYLGTEFGTENYVLRTIS